jgi:hypothetical protein
MYTPFIQIQKSFYSSIARTEYNGMLIVRESDDEQTAIELVAAEVNELQRLEAECFHTSPTWV